MMKTLSKAALLACLAIASKAEETTSKPVKIEDCSDEWARSWVPVSVNSTITEEDETHTYCGTVAEKSRVDLIVVTSLRYDGSTHTEVINHNVDGQELVEGQTFCFDTGVIIGTLDRITLLKKYTFKSTTPKHDSYSDIGCVKHAKETTTVSTA